MRIQFKFEVREKTIISKRNGSTEWLYTPKTRFARTYDFFFLYIFIYVWYTCTCSFYGDEYLFVQKYRYQRPLIGRKLITDRFFLFVLLLFKGVVGVRSRGCVALLAAAVDPRLRWTAWLSTSIDYSRFPSVPPGINESFFFSIINIIVIIIVFFFYFIVYGSPKQTSAR